MSIFFLRLVTLGCLTKVISDEGLRLTEVVTIFPVIPFLREGAYSWLTKPAALKNAADTEAQCGCEHGNSPKSLFQQACNLLSLSELLQGQTTKQAYQNNCFPW